MGFDCELEEAFHFTYYARLDNDLTEHEFDHVFTCTFDGEPTPNPAEVGSWKWTDIELLLQDIEDHPGRYTVWFKIALDQVIARQ